jgi:hypothetical protein
LNGWALRFKQILPPEVSNDLGVSYLDAIGDVERLVGLEENTIGRKKCSRKINVRREFLFL